MCKELNSRLNTLQANRKTLNTSVSSDNNWLKTIKKLLKTKKITPEIAEEFIERITVYKDKDIRVEIKLKYEDELNTLMDAINEMNREEA